MALRAIDPAAVGARERTLHSSPSSDVYLTHAPTVVEDAPVVVKRTKITCPTDMSRFDCERNTSWCSGAKQKSKKNDSAPRYHAGMLIM